MYTLNKFAEKKCALHTEFNDNKAHFKSQCRFLYHKG